MYNSYSKSAHTEADSRTHKKKHTKTHKHAFSLSQNSSTRVRSIVKAKSLHKGMEFLQLYSINTASNGYKSSVST